MREVFLVKREDKGKAEDALKKDDLVSRQSIVIRECSALGFEEEGYFIILDSSKEALQKAEELLKGLAEKYKNKEEVLAKFDEQEESAMQGFGMIVGG